MDTNYHQMNERRAFRDVTNATRGDVDNKAVGKFSKSGLHRNGSSSSSLYSSQSQNLQEEVNKNLITTQTTGLGGKFIEPTRNTNIFQKQNNNKASYQYTGVVDHTMDERDRDDVLCVSDYVMDMYEYFRQTENVVNPNYMRLCQPHINERMRSILIDWLIEVHLKFKLVPETLYLTVNLIDRYLERKQEIQRKDLQLVGVSCLMIASKYEEIYPPELRDLVYICDRAYTGDDIMKMEEIVLKGLEYRITFPSSHTFLVRFLKAAHADKSIVQLACCILDGTLQNYDLCMNYLPSQLAAASVMIARQNFERNPWSPTLLKYARYSEEEIIPVARAILVEKKKSLSPENATTLCAVQKKYSDYNRYGGVSNIDILRNCDFFFYK
mmetsp:Transcript_4946/g.5741  ORF Transcript_4946/g.5741 Transcript_4946/m.5741 type:complete len:383 (+) Transcript_4946:156-1304(+)